MLMRATFFLRGRLEGRGVGDTFVGFRVNFLILSLQASITKFPKHALLCHIYFFGSIALLVDPVESESSYVLPNSLSMMHVL